MTIWGWFGALKDRAPCYPLGGNAHPVRPQVRHGLGPYTVSLPTLPVPPQSGQGSVRLSISTFLKPLHTSHFSGKSWLPASPVPPHQPQRLFTIPIPSPSFIDLGLSRDAALYQRNLSLGTEGACASTMCYSKMDPCLARRAGVQ
jgi:hypothetical protein